MAFSAWQLLSPVQWARWTWSAVRGGGAPEGEDGGVGGEAEEDSQEESKALGFSSDSEGNFETPEAETPGRSPLKELCEPPPGPLQPEAGTQGHTELLGAACQDSSRGLHPEDAAQPEIGAPAADAGSTGESGPEDPSLTQPPAAAQHPAALGTGAGAGCAVGPAPVPHAGTATHEPVMSGGDPAGGDVGLAEQEEDGLAQESSPGQGQLRKGKPPSPGRKGEGSVEPAAEEPLVPPASYHFDPEQYDESVNPFVAGGCKLQSSPPTPRRVPLPVSEPGGDLAPQTKGQVPKAEVDVTEGGEGTETRRATPRKGSRIPASKLTPKRHRDPTRKPAEDAERGPPEPGVPQGPPRAAAAPWDSPDPNPFSGSPALQHSPTLPKGSYQFDPDNFDSMDPFKPTKTLASTADCCPAADNSLNEILESQTLEVPDELTQGRDSPKKPKSRLITTTEQVKFLCFLLSGCKVKKYETQALVLDVCAQDEGALISEIPDIANRDGHATDEEKLASTTSVQKPAGLEKKGEPEDDLEYFECSNVPVPAAKHGVEAGFEKELSKQMDKDGPGAFPGSPLSSPALQPAVPQLCLGHPRCPPRGGRGGPETPVPRGGPCASLAAPGQSCWRWEADDSEISNISKISVPETDLTALSPSRT
eukprot:XP_027299393.1 transforming acidic coiled-coil-containing protein 1 isoform X6 [Anas platyrhynchos]